MSASALPPTAPTTLVILLGASAWPNSPGFQASRAFVHAVQGFKDYLLNPRGLGLPAANLLDQFDSQVSSSEQLELLGSFLEERTQTLKGANQAVRDVLVYFVGHGGFAGPEADFYLVLRRTNASSLRASGMAIDALAEVLREKARQMRRYLFLDCCFAAAAFRSFQGGPDQTAITKTLHAFYVQARSSGFPRKGTVLLCSSDQKSPSLLLPDESCTMFSSALLDVLKHGDPHRPLQLSLRDIKELAEDRLVALPEKNAPRPGLHSPDQSEGDVADVPFFPNPGAEEERRRAEEAQRTLRALEKHTQKSAAQGSVLPRQPLPPTTPPPAVLPPQGRVPYASTIPPRAAMSLPRPTVQSFLSTTKHLKRLRSPFAIALLVFLILALLGSGSFAVYRIVSGNWPVSSSTSLGQTWTTRASGTKGDLVSVVGTGSGFFAAGTRIALTSSDGGITWTPHTISGDTINGVDYCCQGELAWSDTLNRFVDAGLSGIFGSSDGSHWDPGTGLSYPDNSSFFGVTWWRQRSQFVAVGNNSVVVTSFDGSTWHKQATPSVYTLRGVACSDSVCVAVGGSIVTSSDGSTWHKQDFPTSSASHPPELQAITWSGSQFVAMGDQDIILTSPDGNHWTLRLSGVTASEVLEKVACSTSVCVAIGSTGDLFISPDGGNNWHLQTVLQIGQSSSTHVQLTSIAWSASASRFVAVGMSGVILTSP